MTIIRRRILAATAAAALPAPGIAGIARAETKKPKISHQFPGGTIDTGDFRDQLCRRFAAELEKRTKGALDAEVYPNSSLVKTVAQYSAHRRGALSSIRRCGLISSSSRTSPPTSPGGRSTRSSTPPARPGGGASPARDSRYRDPS